MLSYSSREIRQLPSEFFLNCFLDSFNNLSIQKGSLYGITVIARMDSNQDKLGLAEKAMKVILKKIYMDSNLYWFVGNPEEKITSYHEQFITQCSAIYSLSIVKSYKKYIKKLVPGVYYLASRLTSDSEKTIGAEILIPYYLDKLLERNIISDGFVINSVQRKYKGIRERKVKSGSDTVIFSLEGLESEDAIIRKASSFIDSINSVEPLVALTNYGYVKAYEKLARYFNESREYTSAFEESEIFDIGWQFHILMYSGILSEDQVEEASRKSIPFIEAARFDEKEGISISKDFSLRDADSTAMISKLLAKADRSVSVSVFDSYISRLKGRYFFCSYKGEIRPSMGTMADILDASVYCTGDNFIVRKYIEIIHLNLLEAVRKNVNDIDKWHLSKMYFYSNALIAYVNIIKKFSINGNIDAEMLLSLISVRDNICEFIVRTVGNRPLACEELAWALLGLYYYVVNVNLPEFAVKTLKDIIKTKGGELCLRFDRDYNASIEKLEKMWVVKVTYSPFNILRTLIYSAIKISAEI